MNKKGSAILILIGIIALLSLVYVVFYIINNRVWEHIGDQRIPLSTEQTSQNTALNEQNGKVTIQVRDPFSPKDVRAYAYEFSFDQNPADKIVKMKDTPNDKFETGLKIIRDNATLTITPVFEGAPNAYLKSVNPILIKGAKISGQTIHRIEPGQNVNEYYYVDDYKEGVKGCADMTPAPTACSFQQVSGMVIKCETSRSWVSKCDDIFKSLTFRFVPVDVSTWKNFESKELGFSLKLPPDWEVDKLRSNRERSDDDVVFNPSKEPAGESHEGISVDSAENKTAQEFLNMLLKNEGKKLETGTIEVGGEQAKFAKTDEFGITVVFVVHKGKLYTINSQSMIQKGILSTLKFID